MRPLSTNPEGGEIPIIRPLLCTTRDYIEHYLRDIRHLAWVNDSTNTDTRIARNAVRQQLSHYTKAEIEHIGWTKSTHRLLAVCNYTNKSSNTALRRWTRCTMPCNEV